MCKRDEVEYIKTFNRENLLYVTISYHIAPSILENKPSTMLTFSKDDRDLYKLWKNYGNEYVKLMDIEAFELAEDDKKCTVLFYEKQKLEKIIFNNENMQFLRSFGYNNCLDLTKCLNHLKDRFKVCCPHEMGIFLGIPLKDVQVFICGEKKDCLLCGYWKVYYNEKEARDTFIAYDKAKEKVIHFIKAYDKMDVEKFKMFMELQRKSSLFIHWYMV